MEQDIKQYRLAFLGTGKMATSIISVLSKAGHIEQNQIIATHHREEMIEKLRSEFPSIDVMKSNAKATKLADIIFLCVRPQQFKALLDEVQPDCTPDKIIVSIAAGIRVETLRRRLPSAKMIFHLHPSSLIFQLEKKFCVSFLTSVPQYPNETQLIIDIFFPISEVLIIEESQLDKYIVMLGCVPGYLALLWKYLFEIANELGIEQRMAFNLEKTIIMGIQHSVFEKAYSPEQIIDLIATSGGVTIAGIKDLEKSNLKQVLQSAVNASLQKLKEISEIEL